MIMVVVFGVKFRIVPTLTGVFAKRGTTPGRAGATIEVQTLVPVALAAPAALQKAVPTGAAVTVAVTAVAVVGNVVGAFRPVQVTVTVSITPKSKSAGKSNTIVALLAVGALTTLMAVAAPPAGVTVALQPVRNEPAGKPLKVIRSSVSADA
jgi:hypothetical protein